MLRQAARAQRRIEQAKAEAKDREVIGEALGGKIKATVTLGKQVKNLEFDEALLANEGGEIVRDAICAAINAGLEQAEKAMSLELEKVTGGVKIPGL